MLQSPLQFNSFVQQQLLLQLLGRKMLNQRSGRPAIGPHWPIDSISGENGSGTFGKPCRGSQVTVRGRLIFPLGAPGWNGCGSTFRYCAGSVRPALSSVLANRSSGGALALYKRSSSPTPEGRRLIEVVIVGVNGCSRGKGTCGPSFSWRGSGVQSLIRMCGSGNE